MSRKHFELIATALRTARPDPQNPAYAGWVTARHELMNGLEKENPRFNRQRFAAATEASK